MKKITLIFLLLSSVIFCLDAEVLSLKKILERDYNPVNLSKEFKQKIAADTKGMKDMESEIDKNLLSLRLLRQ